MTDRERKYLIDILNSCERILDFVGTQTFKEFIKDLKLNLLLKGNLG